jgi:hypothetical protein
MRLNDKSAGSLAWFAVLLLLPGVLIMSPTGRISFIALAAFVALVPVIFGSRKRRIFGGIVIAVCLVIGTPTYFEHRKICGLRASEPGARMSPFPVSRSISFENIGNPIPGG